MDKYKFLFIALCAAGLGFLFYQTQIKPQMIRWNCQRQFSSEIAVDACVEAHKISIHF
jgi:hypothetical protein